MTITFCGCLNDNNTSSSLTATDLHNQIPAQKYSLTQEFIQTHEHWEGKVVKVTDGDTVWILLNNGSKIKVRLLGIDTPEIYHENDFRKWVINGKEIRDENWLHHWGLEAKHFAEEKIGGKKVIIVFDNIAPKKDCYGRYLVYVFYWNGTGYEDFNEDLLLNGYARVYSYFKDGHWIIPNFELKEQFIKDEEYAKQHHLGVWSYNS